MEENIYLTKDELFITLNNLLKLSGIIETGGQAKLYLQEHLIKVNGQNDNRRGRKLYENDFVEIEGRIFKIKKK